MKGNRNGAAGAVRTPRASSRRGFTLLEVMIAMAIFFTAIFAILSLVTQNLKAANSLRPQRIDASSLAGNLMLTNRVEEGLMSGDFGALYPGYTWTRQIVMVSTNGLFKVDFVVTRDSGGPGDETTMSLLLFRPESATRPGAGLSGGRQVPGARR